MTVSVAETPGQVWLISWVDGSTRNQLTDDSLKRLEDAISQCSANVDCRAVILQGDHSYFCTGASSERILSSSEDRLLAVRRLYWAIAQCQVPVVAAAAGHALGGGLLLALFCDAAVLGNSSRYSLNFVQLGFSPTLGSSHLAPARLGGLGTEMLMSGRAVLGTEIAARSAWATVVERDRVAPRAALVARTFAAVPREVSSVTKAVLTAPLLCAIETAEEWETPAHARLVAQPYARKRVEGFTAGGPSSDLHQTSRRF